MTAARLAALAAVLCLAGCDRSTYRADTELRPDGSVTRTVLQKDLAWEPGDGGVARPGRLPDPGDWYRPLAEEPAVGPPADGSDPLAEWAQTTATAAADLPSAVRLTIPDAPHAPPAVLHADATVTDHGPFTLYDWRETLSAGTDPVRMERARREAVELAAWYAEAALNAGLAGEVDAAPLAAWMRTTGSDWSADLQAAFFAEQAAPEPVGIRFGPANTNELRPFAAVCGDYGLDFFDDGELVSGKEADRRFVAFARDLLNET